MQWTLKEGDFLKNSRREQAKDRGDPLKQGALHLFQSMRTHILT